MKMKVRWIIFLLKRFGKRVLKQRKRQIVALINDKIDLPKMDEEQEQKLLDAIYDAILDVLENL